MPFGDGSLIIQYGGKVHLGAELSFRLVYSRGQNHELISTLEDLVAIARRDGVDLPTAISENRDAWIALIVDFKELPGPLRHDDALFYDAYSRMGINNPAKLIPSIEGGVLKWYSFGPNLNHKTVALECACELTTLKLTVTEHSPRNSS